MKNLRTAILCAVLALGTLGVNAQNDVPVNQPDYNKPRLFNNLPDRMVIGTDRMESLLSLSVGDPVSFTLTGSAAGQFNGEVISASTKYSNSIQTVVIRSTNFSGATLTISRVHNEEGNVSYTGRLLSIQHGDLLELKLQGTEYVLAKKGFYDLVNE